MKPLPPPPDEIPPVPSIPAEHQPKKAEPVGGDPSIPEGWLNFEAYRRHGPAAQGVEQVEPELRRVKTEPDMARAARGVPQRALTDERLKAREGMTMAARRFDTVKQGVLVRASTKSSSNPEERPSNLGQKALGAASRVATTVKANALGAVALVTPVDTLNTLKQTSGTGSPIDSYRSARDSSLPYGSRSRAVAIGLGALASDVWNRMRGKKPDIGTAQPLRQDSEAAVLAEITARRKARQAAASGQQVERSEPSDTVSIDALLEK